MLRRVATALVLGVLAASGAYALIYLFRWEWHRAIITALFFVAAEVGFGISVLLRRLGRLDQKIDALAGLPDPRSALTTFDGSQGPGAGVGARDVDPAVLGRIKEAAPRPSKPFAWLDPNGSQLGVFLPFLLGVGALASGLAWIVEQMARRATTPALERRLARRLAPLALPAEGLLGPPAVLTTPPRRRARWLVATAPAVAVTAVLGLGVSGIDWLGDALQSRPDAPIRDVATRIEVELRGSRSNARPEQVAATLWGTCSHVLHGTVPAPLIRAGEAGRIELTVATHVGSHAEERLRGCLQDAVVDRVQATVVGLELIANG